MKPLFDISSNFAIYLLLGFLFSINLSIAAGYILFSLLLIVWIVSLLRGSRIPALPGYFKYFLIFIFFSLVSTLFSIDRIRSLKDNKEFFIFLLIPLVLAVIDSLKKLKLSLIAVLASACVSALIGIFTALKTGGVSLDYRLRGLTSHWMTYAGLLMLTFIFFFVFSFYEKDKKNKISLALSLLFILASILLSLTRSAWVGVFVAIGLFIVYFRPKILYAAIPAVIILGLFLPGSVKGRLVSIFDLHNATNQDRVYMVRVGLAIAADYPLTGVGPNNIDQVYDRYKPAEAQLSNPHLHNNFLQVLAERGILGLIAFLLALIAIFVGLVKGIRRSAGLLKQVFLSVFFMFIGFLTAGLFEYNFGDSEIKFLLFFFLAIPFIRLPGEITTGGVKEESTVRPAGKNLRMNKGDEQ
jgi:O-antigen ligase